MIDDDLLVIEMIGNDSDDIDGQSPDPPPIEQVIQTMPEAGDHDDDLHFLGFIMEVVFHTQTPANI